MFIHGGAHTNITTESDVDFDFIYLTVTRWWDTFSEKGNGQQNRYSFEILKTIIHYSLYIDLYKINVSKGADGRATS